MPMLHGSILLVLDMAIATANSPKVIINKIISKIKTKDMLTEDQSKLTEEEHKLSTSKMWKEVIEKDIKTVVATTNHLMGMSEKLEKEIKLDNEKRTKELENTLHKIE